MKVPFRLRRLDPPRPAQAWLLPAHEPEALFALLARLPALPRVHRIADGFLLRFDAPSAAPCASVVRLRACHEHVLVPVDAELVPALLDDEARGIVRDRGLIFLPHGRVLSYFPDRPLELATLLDLGPRRNADWESLPTVLPLAERICSIALDRPAEDADQLLGGGNEDIGSDAPQPNAAGPVSQALGQAMLGAGKALHGLGNMMGLRGLAAAGAGLMGKAMSLAPRLSESILGKQEAALRELLRRFREGKLEDALRHALPLAGPGGRGGSYTPSISLPMQSWLYSLSSLLGSAGGGAGAFWFSSQDTQLELAREYRKAAEQAAQKGDFRRAALIYAKLLHDYRAAAQVLLRGGLFHDAAIVFLKKLDDRKAAAQAFEAGGEFDRALELYRQLEEHLLAAYLLRRLGDEEAAVAEFVQAAERQAAGGDYQAAGVLMLDKARRADLAEGYFATGWQRRPAGNAVACAVRLAHLHADRGEGHRLLPLADEAGMFFAPPGNEVGAEQFYNVLTTLADRPPLEPLREELRDRALMGLALKLRQRAGIEAKSGNIVSNLLGTSGHWPAPVVRDAQFAVAATVQPRNSPFQRPTTRVRLGTGQVTAAARAAHSGEVFVGFLSGDVAVYRPASGEALRIKSGDGWAVEALSASSTGQAVLVLQEGEERPRLSSYSRGLDNVYFLDGALIAAGQADYWLPAMLAGEKNCWYLVGSESSFQVRYVSSIMTGDLRAPVRCDQVLTALVFSTRERNANTLAVLLYAHNLLWYDLAVARTVPDTDSFHSLSLGWTPAAPEPNSLRTVPLACLLYGNELELAGVDAEGVLHWSRLAMAGNDLRLSGACDGSRTDPYLAAALVRPGLVAAVTKSRVECLRAGRNSFTVQTNSEQSLSQAVACYVSAATQELLVVCRDGVLERLPLPA